MPELASPPSLMLACTAVTSVTPKGSIPTVLTQCHPHLTLSCRASCWRWGQVLQEEGEGVSSLHKCRVRGGTCKYLGSESTYSQAFTAKRCPEAFPWFSFFPQVSKHHPANALWCQMFPYLLENYHLLKQGWPC